MAAADLNGNGEVDVFDVTKAVNIILGTDVAGAKMRGAVPVDETGTMLLTTNSQGTNLMVDDAERYVAMQFDVVVADGGSLSDVALNGCADEFYMVGDCVAAKNILAATTAAHQAAKDVGRM